MRREPIGTRIELNEIRWMQTTHSRLSAHGRHADVAAAGRRRRPRSPAHARGRPSRPAIRSCINTAVPCKHGGQPRIGPAPGGTTTALCIWRGVPRPRMRPGCQARWLGVRRRPNSRWPQPAHEQALLLARRLRSKQAAPRAWAGEPALGHLPCCTLARSLRRISASGRALRIVTGGAPDAQFGGRLSGGELSEASSASRPSGVIRGRQEQSLAASAIDHDLARRRQRLPQMGASSQSPVPSTVRSGHRTRPIK